MIFSPASFSSGTRDGWVGGLIVCYFAPVLRCVFGFLFLYRIWIITVWIYWIMGWIVAGWATFWVRHTLGLVVGVVVGCGSCVFLLLLGIDIEIERLLLGTEEFETGT